MLHEVLLGLYGHPSPLLSANPPESVVSLASPTELALLRSLTALGSIHTEIRNHCASLSALSRTRQATVVPAVAVAILDGPLADFQQHVRTVEQGILLEDASLVGAYRAVPLASIAAEFFGWERVLKWVRSTVVFMQQGRQSSDAQKGGKGFQALSGAKVLDYLRNETRTGYPDVERVCRDLLRAGETAWVRQLAAWLLYGTLPDVGSEDFLVQSSNDQTGSKRFRLSQDLVPGFVTASAAASILFIGRSIHYVQDDLLRESNQTLQADINILRLDHLKQLSDLAMPILPTAFARVMAAIRLSLARNALQRLLPIATVRHTLRVLREIFLLERGEFAMALIGTVDAHLAARTRKSSSAGSDSRDPRILGGALIKEAELSTILSKTWAALAALQSEVPDSMDEWEDEVLDTARDKITLHIRRLDSSGTKQPRTRLITAENVFSDMVIGMPTDLAMTVSFPLDMFVGAMEIEAYTHINAYLLSLRRTHMHLTSLTALSVLRRTHPAPPQLPVSPQTSGMVSQARERARQRMLRMRRTWATVSCATYALGELSVYLQREVIIGSQDAFDTWMSSSAQPSSDRTPSQTGPYAGEAPPPPLEASEQPTVLHGSEGTDTAAPQADAPMPDPATLRAAHRQYLRALADALLLNDTSFTRAVRDMLARAEHLVALMHRLSVVVETNLAAEARPAQSTVPNPMEREEDGLAGSLRQAVALLQKSLRDVLARLRQLDEEQLRQGMAAVAIEPDNKAKAHDHKMSTTHTIEEEEEELMLENTGFVPWKGPGLGRLLMRLDMAAIDPGQGLDRTLR